MGDDQRLDQELHHIFREERSDPVHVVEDRSAGSGHSSDGGRVYLRTKCHLVTCSQPFHSLMTTASNTKHLDSFSPLSVIDRFQNQVQFLPVR